MLPESDTQIRQQENLNLMNDRARSTYGHI